MNKWLKNVAVGVTLAVSSVGAFAASYDIVRTGNVEWEDDTGFFGDSFSNQSTTKYTGKTFLTSFALQLGSLSDIGSAVTSISLNRKFDLDVTGFSLLQGSNIIANGVQVWTGPTDLWTLSLAGVQAGSYTLAVTGKVLGTTGGSFGGNLNVSPVPEPATWGMMLSGVALVGVLARRRKIASGGMAPAANYAVA